MVEVEDALPVIQLGCLGKRPVQSQQEEIGVSWQTEIFGRKLCSSAHWHQTRGKEASKCFT